MSRQRKGRDEFRPRTEYLRQSVAEAVKRPDRYVSNADYDTGDSIQGIELISPEQDGAVSTLHAKWQEESVVDKLERGECEALAHAGFKVRKTHGDYWVMLRERRISHLYVAHLRGEWAWARAGSLRGCRFRPTLGEGSIQLPLWDNYPSTSATVVRETAYAALQILGDKVPPTVLGESFYDGMRILCDEVVGLMNRSSDFYDLVYQKIPSHKGRVVTVKDVEAYS